MIIKINDNEKNIKIELQSTLMCLSTLLNFHLLKPTN